MTTKNKILNTITQNGGAASLAAIRDATGLPDGTIRRNLTELKNAMVLTNAHRTWALVA